MMDVATFYMQSTPEGREAIQATAAKAAAAKPDDKKDQKDVKEEEGTSKIRINFLV